MVSQHRVLVAQRVGVPGIVTEHVSGTASVVFGLGQEKPMTSTADTAKGEGV
jgi:hypothetical protein